MSIEAHLAELQRRHQALEAEIAEARVHPSIDSLQIVELKRRKLLVKDEIARLQNSSRFTSEAQVLRQLLANQPSHRRTSAHSCVGVWSW